MVDKLVNNASYPNIVSDYERSFAELRKMPCDVFLGPHGGFFNLEEKRKQRLAQIGAIPECVSRHSTGLR